MERKCKCGVCGFEFEYNDINRSNPFVTPYNDGAKYYYDLWHFAVIQCPNCGYCAKNITTSQNKTVIKDSKYLGISNMDLIKELNSTRPNKVEPYLKASYYYESIGDVLNQVKCLLQAGDCVYGELMYWEDYVFDNSDSISVIINRNLYNEIKKFADYLYNTAVENLETYVKENDNDMDSFILLAGTLLDGNKIQSMKGTKYLTSIKTERLTIAQKSALDFLLNSIS